MLSKNTLRMRKHSEEISEGSWAVSYGDMITLLLSFFVLFFSMDFNKTKEKNLDETLLSQFNTLSLFKEDKKEISEKIIDQNIGIVQINDGTFLLFFKNVSFFKSGETELTNDGKEKLNHFYQKYISMASKYKVKAFSYTDGKKVKSMKNRNFKDNLELSVLRSLNAIRYLNKLGVPSRRLEITGSGEMPTRLQELLELNKLTPTERDAFSRTISIVLSRDEDNV
ncbi:MAG: OmpA family protein [Bacteriovoracaceae bacterium]|nr:OmpA family protein [Bacteriovoracaceae bacterium]